MGYNSNFTITLLTPPTMASGGSADEQVVRAEAAQRIVNGEDIAAVTTWVTQRLATLRQPLLVLRDIIAGSTNATDVEAYTGGVQAGSCKWYEMPADMARISISFPGAVIQVDRYGEEDGDIERTWFADGKATPGVKPRMVWPEFDRAMLGAKEP